MKRKEIFEILESCKEGERSQGMHGISMADTIVKVEEIGQDSIGTTAKVSFPGALPGSGQILKKK